MSHSRWTGDGPGVRRSSVLLRRHREYYVTADRGGIRSGLARP